MHPGIHVNSDIHRELGVETVASIITRYATSHKKHLQDHVNEEASVEAPECSKSNQKIKTEDNHLS